MCVWWKAAKLTQLPISRQIGKVPPSTHLDDFRVYQIEMRRPVFQVQQILLKNSFYRE